MVVLQECAGRPSARCWRCWPIRHVPAEQANVRTVLAEMGRPARERAGGHSPRGRSEADGPGDPDAGRNERPEGRASTCSGPGGRQRRGGAGSGNRGAAAIDRASAHPAEAVRLLTDAARTYFDRRQPIEGVVDGQVELWRWDEGKRQCVAKTCARRTTPRGRWRPAGPATPMLLAPDDREVRLLVRGRDARSGGLREGPRSAAGRERSGCDRGQAGRRQSDRRGAGLCGRSRPSGGGDGGGPIAGSDRQGRARCCTLATSRRPLASALQNPDRRLRMAALEAIVRLQPTKPFAGLQLRAGGLGLLRGQRRRPPRAGRPARASRRPTSWRGMLGAAGYQCETALNGKDLLRLAAHSPDYEIALDRRVDRPAADQHALAAIAARSRGRPRSGSG